MTTEEKLYEIARHTQEIARLTREVNAEVRLMGNKPPNIIDKIVWLGAGHGGLDQNGEYTTSETWWKRHFHPELKEDQRSHNKGWIYEGVANRYTAALLEKKFKQEGIMYKRTYHPVKDWELAERSRRINDDYHRLGLRGYVIDLHSNASQNHDARGFCVFTSKGETQSDPIANYLYEEVGKFLGPELMRPAIRRKGQYDYDVDFWMVQKTSPPAILPEFLFFDNLEDAKLLLDPKVQEKYVQAIFNTTLWAFENLSLN